MSSALAPASSNSRERPNQSYGAKRIRTAAPNRASTVQGRKELALAATVLAMATVSTSL